MQKEPSQSLIGWFELGLIGFIALNHQKFKDNPSFVTDITNVYFLLILSKMG